jgi:alpha-amylase
VFGGLYLPHLRSALYRELIAAETGLAPAETAGGGAVIERGDLDLDGDDDALIETSSWAAWISSRGARMWALDDRRALWNWGDTLARRLEAYHDRLREATVGGGEGQTIHGTVRLKEPGLARLVGSYDTRGRDSFLDRWSGPEGDHDWALDRFVFESGGGARTVVLEAPPGPAPSLTKIYNATENGLEVVYLLAAPKARRGRLTIELNLAIHVPRAEDRFVEVDGTRAEPPEAGATARHGNVSRVSVVDGWADRRIDLHASRPAWVERAPIETVSLSEGGAERVFQGLSVAFGFEAELEPGKAWSVSFVLAVGHAVPAPPVSLSKSLP